MIGHFQGSSGGSLQSLMPTHGDSLMRTVKGTLLLCRIRLLFLMWYLLWSCRPRTFLLGYLLCSDDTWLLHSSRKRLDVIPNGTMVNLSTWTLFSKVGYAVSVNQRNLVTSLSLGWSPTWWKAFSTSATRATLLTLNLISRPHKSSVLLDHGVGFHLGFYLPFWFKRRHQRQCSGGLLRCHFLMVWDLVLECRTFIRYNFSDALL